MWVLLLRMRVLLAHRLSRLSLAVVAFSFSLYSSPGWFLVRERHLRGSLFSEIQRRFSVTWYLLKIKN